MKQDHSRRIPLGNYAYVSSLYFVAVGVLYLWGYWPRFGVNVLEYAGLTDIIKTAAYPVASMFVFFALGVIIGEFLVSDDLPAGQGVDTRTGKLFRLALPYIGAAYVVGILLLFLFGPTGKWRILPILVTLPVYWAAKRHGMLADLIPNGNARSIAIFLLAALPFISYGHGRLKAEEVLAGNDFTYARSAVANFSAGVEPVRQRPRYLGVAGNYAFFYFPERGSTFVISLEDLKAVELARYQPTARQEKEKSLVAPQSGSTSNAPL